jgi:hypothetical protein
MTNPTSECFFTVNGRVIYTDGMAKRWRCPVCKWWRDWEEDRCCACGCTRDGASNGGLLRRGKYRAESRP